MKELQYRNRIKRITLISILISLSVILSIFDKLISASAFPFLPSAKIGLANIVILVGVYNFSFKESFIMVVLKSALAGFILGSPISFIISFVASLLAFFGMFFARKLLKNRVSEISISVIGGYLHIMGQLLVINFLYKIGDAVFYYGGALVFVSLITSIIIGFIGIRMNSFVEKTDGIKK